MFGRAMNDRRHAARMRLAFDIIGAGAAAWLVWCVALWVTG